MAADPIGFRPNAEDRRILAAAGDSATATIRRALRQLDHERWLEQFRKDAVAQRDEDLSGEPDAW